jgi:hypothetical protein
VVDQCGDDLTRENLMHQASHMKDFHVPGLLPGIAINTSPTDYRPIKQFMLHRSTNSGTPPVRAATSSTTSLRLKAWGFPIPYRGL